MGSKEVITLPKNCKGLCRKMIDRKGWLNENNSRRFDVYKNKDVLEDVGFSLKVILWEVLWNGVV